jgi:hypothetical protein
MKRERSSILSADRLWSPGSPSFSPGAEDDDASLSSSAELSTARGEDGVGFEDAHIESAVVDDNHAEIAVQNGNLDGQEDQEFGGVNEDVPGIDGQTSRGSPAASAPVQHDDAHHSEGVGADIEGTAVAPGGSDGGLAGTPGGGDGGDDDDNDDPPPHGDRGGGGGPPSGGRIGSTSWNEDSDRSIWQQLDEALEGLQTNFQLVTAVTTFGSGNRARKSVTLTAKETQIGPKYWSAALQALANTAANISNILVNFSVLTTNVCHLSCIQNHHFISMVCWVSFSRVFRA